MTGTVVQHSVNRGYCDNKEKGKIVTTIRLDKGDQEFTVDDKLGELGDSVEITAKLITP